MLTFGDLFMDNSLALAQSVKKLDRIKKMAKRLVEVAIAFPNRTCYRTPAEDHVVSIALPFRSPFTHQSVVLHMFLKDPDFAKSVPQEEAPLVLEIAAGPGELRANFYPVDREADTAVYDPRWPESGVFRYVISADGTVDHVTRFLPAVKYDPTEVIYSYTRRLDATEREQLSLLFRH
jgi:hypothetical protein